MEDNVTFVVKGLSINNYVAPAPASRPEVASPTQDTSTASLPTERTHNAAQSNVIPIDMVEQLLQKAVIDFSKNVTATNDKVLKEIRDIKVAQEDFKKDREAERERYAQLQDQYMKLKKKHEETTTRLKALNKEKYELARELGKLETDRNSIQEEVKALKERQLSDTEKYLSEIQCSEKEIDRIRSKILELEEMIASSKKTHEEDLAQIQNLKEEIAELKEEKGSAEKAKNELSKEIEELKEQSVSSTHGLPSSRHDIQLGRELTMHSFIHSNETKNILTESPRFPRQSDMKRSRPGLKPFRTPGSYNTPRQQAFVGTGSSAASHNIVHKKAHKFASNEYR